MAEDAETLQTLEHLWKDGRNGTMSPLEQMRAWVYREVMREYGEPEHGLYSDKQRNPLVPLAYIEGDCSGHGRHLTLIRYGKGKTGPPSVGSLPMGVLKACAIVCRSHADNRADRAGHRSSYRYCRPSSWPRRAGHSGRYCQSRHSGEARR